MAWRSLLALAVCAVAANVAAGHKVRPYRHLAPRERQRMYREELVAMTRSSRPSHVAAAVNGDAIDCAWRTYALVYAQQIMTLTPQQIQDMRDGESSSGYCG
jgi:hypothetical protein